MVSSKSKQVFLDYLSNDATLFDDIIFKEVAEKKEFVEELLKVFLSDDKLKVISNEDNDK